MQRRSRQNLRGDVSSTIPIRPAETPRSARFTSASAPSTYSPLHTTLQSPSAAFAKMNAGGFKPRQTPARTQMHAAAAAAKEAEEAERARVRKERSGSTTPGPSSSSALTKKIKELPNGDANKGKKPKVSQGVSVK